MRTFIAMLVIICFVAAPLSSFAAKGGKKGPDDNAYEHANDNAKFKRDGKADDASGETGEIGESKGNGKGKDKDKDKDKDKGGDKEKKKKKKKQKGKNKSD